jgi:hypothetical protein
MLAHPATSSSTPPNRCIAESRASAGGELDFTDTLDEVMKDSGPAREKPAAKDLVLQAPAEERPALFAGLQEMPSEGASLAGSAADEPDGAEQSEENGETQSPAESNVGSQAMNILAVPQRPLPDQPAQAPIAWEAGDQAIISGGASGTETEVQAARSDVAAGPGVEGMADGAEAAMAKGMEEVRGQTANEVRPAPGPAFPLAPPVPGASAELRSYVSVGVPPTPARQISPAILSFSAQPGIGAAPSRLVVALRPDELGRVEIAVEQAADGPAEIRLSAERPETLLMLMRDADAIQAVLQQAGIGTEKGHNLSFNLSEGGGGGQPPRERAPRPQALPEQEREEASRMPPPGMGGSGLSIGRIDIAL